MQTKSIVINSSKTVQTMDGSIVEIHKLGNGVFKIDDYVASAVFVVKGQKKSVVCLWCGVFFFSY